MSKSQSRTTRRLVRAGIAAGCTAAALIATTLPASAATAAALTLSQRSGPSAGGNTITALASSAIFTAATTPTVQFQYAPANSSPSCTATLNVTGVTPVVSSANPPVQTAGVVNQANVSDVRKLTTSKLIIIIPAGLALATNATSTLTQSSAAYNLCIYASATAGAALVANSTYTIAAAPTITSVTPATGPALGGTTVTVIGTGFTTGTTASIGGQALTGIVVAANGLSFTGVAPAHVAANDLGLSVTTTGGTIAPAVTAGNGGIDFSYSNGIQITPNTSPTNVTQDIDVSGVGFNALTFADGTGLAEDTSAHVFLVPGAYDAAAAATSPARALGPVAKCTGVLQISDNELICTLDLTASYNSTAGTLVASTPVPNGAYTLTVVSSSMTHNSVIAGYSQTAVTSGATFTVAPY